MVKTSGVKGFFGRTFCCSREVQDTPAVPGKRINIINVLKNNYYFNK